MTVPGDVVALESPTYFGFLDLLDRWACGRWKYHHPRTGLSLPALQLALDTQPVRRCWRCPPCPTCWAL